MQWGSGVQKPEPGKASLKAMSLNLFFFKQLSQRYKLKRMKWFPRKGFNELLVYQVKAAVKFILRKGIPGGKFFEIILCEIKFASRNLPIFFAYEKQRKSLCGK